MKTLLTGGLILVLLIAALPVSVAQEADSAQVMLGGYGRINAIAWSPDGTQLAVSTQTGVVLYDADLNKTAFLVPDGAVKAGGNLAWSPDGVYLASGTGRHPLTGATGQTVTVWDTRTGEIAHMMQVDEGEAVTNLAWNSGGALVMVIQNAQAVQRFTVWISSSNQNYSTEVAAEKFSPMTEWSWLEDTGLVVGLTRAERILFDLMGGVVLERAPYEPPDSVASPDGAHSAALDNGRLVVTTGDGTEYAFGSDEGSRFQGFRELAWAADSQKIVAWGRGVIPNLVVGDVSTGDTIREITYEENGLIARALFSPDSTRLLVITIRDDLLLYDLATGDVIAERWLSGGAISLSFNPDGTRIATVNASRQAVYIWDALTGAEITKLVPDVDPLAAPNYFFTVAWSPDGTMIAAGAQRGGVVTGSDEVGPIHLFIWDAASGDILQTVPAQAFEADMITRLNWSADSRVLAYSTASNLTGQSHFGAWDVSAGDLLIESGFSKFGHILDIALHPAGHLLALAVASSEPNVTGVQVWDLENGTWVNKLPILTGGNVPYALAWHPDGEYLAAMIEVDQAIPAVRVWGPIEWPTTNEHPMKMWFDFQISGFAHSATLMWSPVHDSVLAMTLADDESGELMTGVQFWQIDMAAQGVRLLGAYGFGEDKINLYSYSAVPALDWSPDGSRFAASVTQSRTIIWQP